METCARLGHAARLLAANFAILAKSFTKAERQSMINAINSLRELQRLVQTHPKIGLGLEKLTDA